MLAQYFVSQEVPSRSVLSLPGVRTGIAITVTSLLLYRSGILYLKAMDHEFAMHTPVGCFEYGGIVFLLLLIGVVAYTIGTRTVGLMRYAAKMRLEPNPTNLQLIPHFGWLATVSIATAVLAILGPVFAGVVAEAGPLVHADTGIPNLLAVYIGLALVLSPTIAILLPIARAVPRAPRAE